MKAKTKVDIDDEGKYSFDGQNRGLLPDREYVVVGISRSYIRVLDEQCCPALYPRHLFETIDGPIPDDWVRKDYSSGEYDITPREFDAEFSFEDYFDGACNAKEIFKRYVISRGILTGKNSGTDCE